jgi:hypothetical protein
MTTTEILKCTECGFACDRAWKTYKHADYGLIWLEAGVCRQCWNSFIAKSKQAAKEESLTSTYREAL